MSKVKMAIRQENNIINSTANYFDVFKVFEL